MFQYLPLNLQLCSRLETEAPDLKLIQILETPHIHLAPIRTPLHGVANSPILRRIFLETAPNHPEHLALRVHMVAVVHAQPLPEGSRPCANRWFLRRARMRAAVRLVPLSPGLLWGSRGLAPRMVQQSSLGVHQLILGLTKASLNQLLRPDRRVVLAGACAAVGAPHNPGAIAQPPKVHPDRFLDFVDSVP